jgi:GNAT superfamily N-acetyltransferase
LGILMSQNLRRANEADIAGIEALVSAAYGKYVERIGRKPKPMLTDYRSALANHQLWVLERDEVLVAVLELISAAAHVLIENVAVDPRCQGLGLGRQLMLFAESEAKRQGHHEIRLYTNERFTENLAIYATLGYRETHRELLHGTHLVHMSKPV